MSKRFFTREQVQEYEEIAGKGCEWLVDRANTVVRCSQAWVESGHLTGFAAGGLTIIENLIRECKPHHALQHFLDGEPWSANLIIARMTDQEKSFLSEIAKGIGWNPFKGE